MSDLVERLRQLSRYRHIDVTVGDEAADKIERLRAELAFLHKRRGDLVIERDRYKAALGEYPEGRNVMLGGALAEVERLKALLREAFAQRHRVLSDWPDDLQARIRAALGDEP